MISLVSSLIGCINCTNKQKKKKRKDSSRKYNDYKMTKQIFKSDLFFASYYTHRL